MYWEILLCLLSICSVLGAILGIGYHDRMPGKKQESVYYYIVLGLLAGPILIPVLTGWFIYLSISVRS